MAIGLSKFPIKSKPVFSNGPKSLLKNSPDYIFLCNWVFDNFQLADKSLGKLYEMLFEVVLSVSVADCLAWSRSFCTYHSHFYLYIYQYFYPHF